MSAELAAYNQVAVREERIVFAIRRYEDAFNTDPDYGGVARVGIARVAPIRAAISRRQASNRQPRLGNLRPVVR